jgi:hypothetical protein
VLEELVKHLHIRSMCAVAHHAAASTAALSERGRDGGESDEEHLNSSCCVNPFRHDRLLRKQTPSALNVNPS